MYTAGRNDPCPCGSGKKYKKCCIDKSDADRQANWFTNRLSSFLTYEKVNVLSTDEIIYKLQSMGIAFNKETFLCEIKRFYSAEQLSSQWLETYKVTAKGSDGDFPWFAAWVLWDRLSPENMLCMEQMNDLIDKGFEVLSENDSTQACDIWLKVWEAIKCRIRPELRTMEYLDEEYKKCFFISNFCQDLESEFHNAGLANPIYFEKRVNYCKEFLSYFPDEDELIIHNMRRAVIDSYIRLKAFEEAEKSLEDLVKDYPDNPWTYIEYGDRYFMQDDDRMKDLQKAKAFYMKALSIAKNDSDKKAVEERLEDLQKDLLQD